MKHMKQNASRACRAMSDILYAASEAWDECSEAAVGYASEVARRGRLWVRFRISDAACACGRAARKLGGPP